VLEVADGGDKGRRCDGADALQLGGALHRFVVLVVRADPLVAPFDVFVELAPMACARWITRRAMLAISLLASSMTSVRRSRSTFGL
jgi:hypothetical protein